MLEKEKTKFRDLVGEGRGGGPRLLRSNYFYTPVSRYNVTNNVAYLKLLLGQEDGFALMAG